MSFAYLRHPLVLSALILTFLNDHFFKYQFPGFITGKISDFTGIFFFPLFIYALVVFIQSPKGRHNTLNKTGLLACILVTDILFIVFKYTEARIWLSELFNNYFFKIKIAPDITDISAVSMNLATYFFSRHYSKKTN